ncbi:MAG TPA: hypothetical protein VIH54_21155, partial [Chthoniobacterales bacterium]
LSDQYFHLDEVIAELSKRFLETHCCLNQRGHIATNLDTLATNLYVQNAAPPYFCSLLAADCLPADFR